MWLNWPTFPELLQVRRVHRGKHFEISSADYF